MISTNVRYLISNHYRKKEKKKDKEEGKEGQKEEKQIKRNLTIQGALEEVGDLKLLVLQVGLQNTAENISNRLTFF